MEERIPEDERQLIAVVHDHAVASDLVARLGELGVPPDEIRVADPRDEPVALRAEMRAEMTDSVLVPGQFLADKEGARGCVFVGALCAVGSVLLAFLVALAPYGLTYWGRWLLALPIILAFSVSLTLVLGRAFGTKGDRSRNAADRGVVVRVLRDDGRIRDVIIASKPIRLDEINATSDPIGSVYSENQAADDQLADKVKHTARHINRKLHEDE